MPSPFRRSLIALLVAVALPAANAVAADTASTWLDSYQTRLEALALLQTLNADLLSHDSATATLDRWCASHHLGDPPSITAERIHDADKPATAAQRELLHVSATEPVAYRHVRLHCGTHVLSEADNWYVPARLTPEMNQALEHSDVPFGRAIEALHFQRHTLSADLLWAPLPTGWEMTGPTDEHDNKLMIPANVLQHTAVLSLPDGTPISALTETYTSDVLAFPEPR
jgi:chorismate-pyruvate lyase